MRNLLVPLRHIVELSLLVGCASGGTTFNSKVSNGLEDLQIASVLIYANMKSQFFDDSTIQGFNSSVTAALNSCGIAARVLIFDPLEIVSGAAFKQAITEFRPDAVVTIQRDGGNMTTGSGGNSGELYFLSKMYSQKTQKEIWMAKLSFRTLTANIFVNNKSSGEKFGSQFVAQLGHDVVPKCNKPGQVH